MLIFKFFFGGILHLYERIFSLSGKSFDLNVNYFQLPAFPISIPIISYPDLTLSNLRQGDLGTIFPHKNNTFLVKGTETNVREG